jgi:hypothetical protein
MGKTEKSTTKVSSSSKDGVKKSQVTKKKGAVLALPAFDISNLSFSELDMNNERSSAQGIAYVRYKDGNLLLKTDPIKLVQGGVKKIDGKWVMTDKDRQYIRIPFDKTQPSSVALFKVLTSIDNYVKKNTKKILGKYASLFEPVYQPLVRDPFEDETRVVKPGDKVYEKFQYCQAKLEVNFDSGRVETVVFDDTTGDGPVKVELVEGTVTEFAEEVAWQSTAKFVLSFAKLWMAKTGKGKSKERDFGIILKLKQCAVTEKAERGSKDTFQKYAFGDADEEEIEVSDDEDEQKADGESDKEDEEESGSQDGDNDEQEAGAEDNDEVDADADAEEEEEEEDQDQDQDQDDGASEPEEEEEEEVVEEKPAKKSGKGKEEVKESKKSDAKKSSESSAPKKDEKPSKSGKSSGKTAKSSK